MIIRTYLSNRYAEMVLRASRYLNREGFTAPMAGPRPAVLQVSGDGWQSINDINWLMRNRKPVLHWTGKQFRVSYEAPTRRWAANMRAGGLQFVSSVVRAPREEMFYASYITELFDVVGVIELKSEMLRAEVRDAPVIAHVTPKPEFFEQVPEREVLTPNMRKQLRKLRQEVTSQEVIDMLKD